MNPRPYRSLFWPVLLIGIGILWLLSNAGLIAPINAGMVVRLWPVLLIVIGLDILFGRQSPLIGSIIGVLAVVFIIGVLAFGSTLGFYRAPRLVTEQLIEPVGSAESANVSLDLSEFHNEIHSVSGDNLIDANVTHYGNVVLRSTGETNKQVRLTRNGDNMNWLDFTFEPNARWDIGLTGQIPLELNIDAGSGSTDADLSGLQLSELSVDVGSGSLQLSLPAGEERYTANLSGGSGSMDVNAACGVELHLDGGSGSQTIDVPDDCPVRVDVRDGGSGSINVRGMDKVDSGDDSDEGVWETAGFDQDGDYTLIVVDGHGSGSLNIR